MNFGHCKSIKINGDEFHLGDVVTCTLHRDTMDPREELGGEIVEILSNNGNFFLKLRRKEKGLYYTLSVAIQGKDWYRAFTKVRHV